MLRYLRTRLQNRNDHARHRAEIRALNALNPSCTISEHSYLTNCSLSKHVIVHAGSSLTDVSIGKHTYVTGGCEINNATIGSFCSVGPETRIGLDRHPTRDFVSTYPAFFATNNLGCLESFVNSQLFDEGPKKTTIHNDVWIGTSCIIPGGITIGNGAIIAAGSVVVKNVPDFAIVGGNPAALIRFRFAEPEIVRLLDLQWWELEDDELQTLARLGAFSSIDSLHDTLSVQGHREHIRD